MCAAHRISKSFSATPRLSRPRGPAPRAPRPPHEPRASVVDSTELKWLSSDQVTLNTVGVCGYTL
eukprot:scaffold48575_cov45-Phaeocystis_antarctica.AAC.1